MSRPGPPGDHTVRSLAEILQEHGLESEYGTRPGRRRREGESRADWPARPAPEDQPPSKLRPGPEAGTGARPSRPRAPQPPRPDGRSLAETQAAAAEILREHGLESEYGTRPGRRRPSGSKADWPALPAPEDQPPSRLRPPAEPRPGARVARPREAPREEARPRSGTPATGRSVSSPSPPAAPAVPAPAAPVQAPAAAPRATRAPATPSIPAARPSRRTAAPRPTSTDDPVATGSFAAVVAGATGEVPALPAQEPPTPGQSALAWARFAGELVLAVAVGVGTYFAFTVLWELMPYVAMVAAPLVLTALVAGVAAWRHRREQAQLGVPLLAVLVFAGTLLVIAPAAGLLAGR